MQQNTIKLSLTIIALTTISAIISCNKEKSNTSNSQPETEILESAFRMDTALHHTQTYHDSVVFSHTHNPSHQAHYDSIYHHHDSIYHHNHTIYHHGDTTHHHTGWHHTPTQHHQHDSLHNLHHTLFN